MSPTTLQSAVSTNAKARADHPALICGETSVSYAELHRRGWMTAHALDATGIGPGSRVAHVGRDSAMYYDLLLGCAITGAVLVPLDPRLGAAELERVLRDSGAELLCHDPSLVDVVGRVTPALPALRSSIPLEDNEFARWREGETGKISVPVTGWDTPVLQVYAAAATDAPRGVVLAQRTFFAIGRLLAEHGLDWIDWWPDDRSLVALPGFDVGGPVWVAQGLIAGVTNVIMPEFDGGLAVRLVREHGLTTGFLTSRMLRLALDAPGAGPEDLRTLRKISYGDVAAGDDVVARIAATLDTELVRTYGLAETGGAVVFLPPSRHLGGRADAAGRACPGVGLRIVDESGREVPPGVPGLVQVNSPARMVEYWNRPDKTEGTLVDGWIRTGDRGFVDADGYLFV